MELGGCEKGDYILKSIGGYGKSYKL